MRGASGSDPVRYGTVLTDSFRNSHSTMVLRCSGCVSSSDHRRSGRVTTGYCATADRRARAAADVAITDLRSGCGCACPSMAHSGTPLLPTPLLPTRRSSHRCRRRPAQRPRWSREPHRRSLIARSARGVLEGRRRRRAKVAQAPPAVRLRGDEVLGLDVLCAAIMPSTPILTSW